MLGNPQGAKNYKGNHFPLGKQNSMPKVEIILEQRSVAFLSPSKIFANFVG